MSIIGKIKKVRDENGEYFFPVTSSKAILMEDGETKLSNKLDDIQTKADNWIDFKNNGGKIGENGIVIDTNSSRLLTSVNNTWDIGSQESRWSSLYLSETCHAKKLWLTNSHGCSISYFDDYADHMVFATGDHTSDKKMLIMNKACIYPQVDGTTFDLGRDTQKFSNIFLDSYSSGENGYTKLPNKMILQWGTVRGNIGDFISTTLPVAFPNKSLVCGATVTKNCTASHANMHLQLVFCSCQRWGNNLQIVFGSTSSLSDEFQADWFAIGY